MLFYNQIRKAYLTKVDASGLAVFRVAYFLVFLAELLQFFHLRHLIFDSIPYVKPGPVDPTVPPLLWMASVIFIIFGAFTRIFAVVNFIFSIVYLGTITGYEYHMFYIYLGVNFLLIFFWAHQQNISLDSASFSVLIKKIDSPHGWEYDFLDKQIAHPWIKAGEVNWHNKKFSASIAEVESL